MKKSLFTGLLFLAFGLFVVSCGTEGADSNDTTTTAVDKTATPAPTPTAKPAAPAAPTGPTTTMSFTDTTFDFGEVTEGEKVEHSFKFKNSGNEPLILSNAKGSCGCTVPQWPKEPIAPGEEGVITVVFNSKNKKGPRNQKVTITANTNPAQTFIYLKGKVNPDPNKPAAKPKAAPAK